MDSLVFEALKVLAATKSDQYALKAHLFLEDENLLTAEAIKEAIDGDSIASRIDQLLANEEYAKFS